MSRKKIKMKMKGYDMKNKAFKVKENHIMANNKPVKHHIFRGKRYRISFQNAVKGRVLGLCDAPDGKGKTIRIKKDLDEINELETIVHESLHACFWDIDEEAIHESARDIAYLLSRLGYRKEGK